MSSAVKILGIAGGVGAAFIIGIIAYGEMTKPEGFDIFERPMEQWFVGNSLRDDTTLTYNLSHKENNYEELKVTLRFIEEQDENWYLSLTVEDPTNGTIEEDILISKSMIPITPIEPQTKPYMRMVQTSILWIVDYAIEPKYLAGGAVWGSIIHGVLKEDLKITAKEEVITEAGMFDAYVLSYKIKDKESKVWVVRDKPLPVMAAVYDTDGYLQFAFELAAD